MSGSAEVKDLFVLAADMDLANTLEGLLARPEPLRIRSVDFDIERHPYRDSGCRIDAIEYLRPFLKSYRHALVVFDYHGCGSRHSREMIQQDIGENLRRNGWEDRARAIVIDPELEVWVWAESQEVSRVLGWGSRYRELRRWLAAEGLWPAGQPKPPDPKKAMERAMGHSRSPLSARKFRELADTVDFDGCEDSAFNELQETLRAWFPREGRK